MAENEQTSSRRTSDDVVAPQALVPPVVIGIGASAGGLDALRELLSNLPKLVDASIVITQHGGDPEKPLLPELLQAVADMDVVAIEDGLRLKRGHIHVAMPESSAVLKGRDFQVRPIKRGGNRRAQTSIDQLLNSIASSSRERAVGIVLSGNGKDGTLGLQSITQAGGLTMVQDPEDAAHDGMPASAMAGTLIDHVGTPTQLAQYLEAYIETLVKSRELRPKADSEATEASIREICQILQDQTGHDFLHYKTSTLFRRIQRRMQVLHLVRPDDYVEHLRANPSEAQALFRELLIGVTGFFRDAEAFETLSELVIKRLLDDIEEGQTLRIWVAGCGTGEEAYSIGMLVLEALDRCDDPPAFQIFATDIDGRALTFARRALYKPEIAEQVGQERLARFFTKVGRRYQVKRELREHCLFSLHSLISDPPFSRVDLVSCRNVMIYFGPHLQKKLMPMFHYALRPGGCLFLGSSENFGQHSDLFKTVDAKARIAQRKVSRLAPAGTVDARRGQAVAEGWHQPTRTQEAELGAISQRILLDEFAPPYAIVDEEGQVVFLAPGLDHYLQPPSGHFSNNIIRMARAGLRSALRRSWTKALKERRTMRRDGVVFDAPTGKRRVRLTVQPMPELGHDQGLYMVVFHDQGEAISEAKGAHPGSDAEHQLEALEADLARAREELERTVQDLEATNEELKSSNEELLSMNEELQSANEELETSKDEVQAANAALASANNDLRNLLRSMQIATLFLDVEGRIRSFTPITSELYNVTSQDIGRPFNHFTHRFEHLPAMPDAAELADGSVIEDEACHEDGRWFLRRVVAYESGVDRFEGSIVTFVDITAQKAMQARLADAERRVQEQLVELDTLYQTAPVGMALIDRDLRFQRINERLAAINGRSAAEHVGRSIFEIVPDLASQAEPLLRRVLDDGATVGPFELAGETPGTAGEQHVWQETFVPVRDSDGEITAVSVAALDVTERKRSEQALIDSESRLSKVLDGVASLVGLLELDGTLIEANRTALRLAGLQREDVIGKKFWDAYWWSYDPEIQAELKRSIERAAEGEFVRYDVPVRIGDEGLVTIDFQLSPLRNDEGKITHVVPSALDVSERKEFEKTQALLIDELNHRVRNTLTVVKSIAAQTRRHSASLDSFGEAFDGRIQALATTHTLLAESKWQPSQLETLIAKQLATHVSRPDAFSLSGPPAFFKAKAALALSLVFHELATNAAKYGALAAADGRIDVTWTIADGEDGQQLDLRWQESGGPPAAAPRRTGFGSTLIDFNISHEFDGRIERMFSEDGFACEITFPLPNA